ncbi:GMC oxidoreductase [Hydnomerulius pinastri MD-312]|uniref:Pyranose 2-oxidase n=1 Tax=Hydnomerulius pinastri MD-312 TaxID=994086 RepID=A0A0C9WCU0_9AGAM|nr:GMC oxidoreductase [Hydnomerulius pinastri MD-312]
MPKRFSDEDIQKIIDTHSQGTHSQGAVDPEGPYLTDVLIAGSGPVGCAYARTILDKQPGARVLMIEIGSQDGPVIGAHHKNSIKYQKDIDSFVHVVQGALQPLSISQEETHLSTLGGDAWRLRPNQSLVMHSRNPKQQPEVNLRASAATRTVGGMATHWTCCCPIPHEDERRNNPIPWEELEKLLNRASQLLNIDKGAFDAKDFIRHQVVKSTLLKALGEERGITALPLAVKRRPENQNYVTWSGSDTILGDAVTSEGFTLWAEHRVTKVVPRGPNSPEIAGAMLRNLRTNDDVFTVVVCCGAVGTPQVLYNSRINSEALGRYLCEQSLAFCQIVLKQELVDGIETNPDFAAKVKAHRDRYPYDPLPIPFHDPEPQIMIPYSTEHPYHVQIHRDAFSYGEVGSKADSRTVVDLRYFGKQQISKDNRVSFGDEHARGWQPGISDIYGMPQPTFYVTRSEEDHILDHKMMADMTAVANTMGAFLPGSLPQFMEPGLALHITGTTRIGKDKNDSVADEFSFSVVHGYQNLWVGGNGCIPDSTACNPTLTSVAIAIKGAEAVVDYLKKSA